MRTNGKIIYFDYDAIVERDTAQVIVPCLTNAEREILLTMLDYIGWRTRWVSSTQTIDQDRITAWRDSLVRKLSFGGCEMDCADVWACLLPAGQPIPEDILSWLIDQLGNNGDVITVINNPGTTGESSVVDELMYTHCDTDYLFGFIRQLIQFINTAIEDALEAWELMTDTLELYQAIADAVPVLTQVSDFVSYMQDTLIEAYLAGYDTNYEIEVSCELLCIARRPGNECSLTWEQLYEYFLDRFGAGLANKNILDLLQFVLGGGWSGTEFCDALIAVFCGTMYYAGEWSGITLPIIQRWWQSFTDDPDSDWETLCDPCQWRVDYTYDDAQIDDWSIVYGSWIESANPYIASENVTGVHCTAKVERIFTAFDGLKEVWCDGAKISVDDTHVGYGVYLSITHGGGTYTDNFAGNPDGANVEFVLPSTLDGVTYISVEVREDSVGDGGYTRHAGITLIGAGDNPPPETIYE